MRERSFRCLATSLLPVLVLVFGRAAGTAYAGTCNINTMPYWDGNITNDWLAAAQTFAVPSASCDVLNSYEFELDGRSPAGSVQFNIYQWGASGPTGSALYSTTLAWGTSASLFDVTSINLRLTPGQLYGADVDFLGYEGSSLWFQGNQTGYPGGSGWWYNPSFGGWVNVLGSNDYFAANFSGAPTVPEPGTIELLLAGLAAMGLKLWRSRAHAGHQEFGTNAV